MNSIDLRSDTVTRPTPQMLESMFAAPVGDDVYGEDPTVNALQEYAAQLFGKEAALFCPSGTMTNQIAIKVHTQPGDELICADNAHVFKYEGGGIAFNSGVQARTLPGTYGKITASAIEQVINSDDPHFPVTRLVCLENTSNRGGGSIYTLEEQKEIADLCKQHKLALHLDGARLFNALATGQYTASDCGALYDSISICLSKGLGAPVGSLLIGSSDFINKAKRVRKVFGGGMRQAGYLAAAGMYALKHHTARLVQDHQHTQEVATTLEQQTWVRGMLPVESNIIIFQLKSATVADALQVYLKNHQILANKVAPDSLRFVFHLGVTPVQVVFLNETLNRFQL